MTSHRMLSLCLRALGVLGLAATLTLAPQACAQKKGALMLSLNTDMKAPKDVNAIGITVSTNGVVRFAYVERVSPDGIVKLPATIAVVQPEEANATIRIRAVALKGSTVRVLRDVRTTIPRDGRVGLLRLPLDYIDEGVVSGQVPIPGSSSGAGTDAGTVKGANVSLKADTGDTYLAIAAVVSACPKGQTKIDGECADEYVDPDNLPDYSDDAVHPGGEGACFATAKCLANARPLEVNPQTCTAKVEGDTTKLNLAFETEEEGECLYNGLCFVPLDEGTDWHLKDGAVVVSKPYCRKISQTIRIYESHGPGACEPKTEDNPVCQGGEEAPFFVVKEPMGVAVATSGTERRLVVTGGGGVTSHALTDGATRSVGGLTVLMQGRTSISATRDGIAITDGAKGEGYVAASLDGPFNLATEVAQTPSTVTGGALLGPDVWWTVSGATPSSGLFHAKRETPGEKNIALKADFTAIAFEDIERSTILAGTDRGALFTCAGGRCQPIATNETSPIVSIATLGSYFAAVAFESKIVTFFQQKRGNETGADVGADKDGHPSGLAFGPPLAGSSCLYFTTRKGAVQYVVVSSTKVTDPKLLLAGPAGARAYGVAVENGQVYWAVRAATLATSGIYRAPVPKECKTDG